MTYGDFTLKEIQRVFQVAIIESHGLFSKVEKREASLHLVETLAENVSLAVSINTEKARSEFIVAPVLVEIRKIFGRKISLFSGIEFDVDKEKKLTGFCDFMISKSPEQLFLKSPVVVIVEAKNDNIMSGLGQCAAEMIASKIFNEMEGGHFPIYGVVTSGNLWKFMKLEESKIFIDLDEYGVKEIEKIIGILVYMVEQTT